MIRRFEQYVVPRVEAGFSDLLVHGTEKQEAIQTDKGIKIVLPTKLYFYCSYVSEWINLLSGFEAKGKGYPFLFINTNGLIQEGNTYTIREMVLATKSSKEWRVEKKRKYVIDPILSNMKDLLISAMRDVFAVDEPFEPRTEVVYSEKDRSKLPEGVDAIVFTNLKLRVIC